MEHLRICTDSLVLGRRVQHCCPGASRFLIGPRMYDTMWPVQSKWTMCSVGEDNPLSLSYCLAASTVNNQEKCKHFQQSGSLRVRERERDFQGDPTPEKSRREREAEPKCTQKQLG